MTYSEFAVRIDRDGDGFRSHVTESPAGTDSSIFVPPWTREQALLLRGATDEHWGLLSGHFSRADGSRMASVGELAQYLGKSLFEALFRGRTKELFDQSLGLSAPHGLRIRLQVNLANSEVSWLGDLPWELMRSPASAKFLALDELTPIVRATDGVAAKGDPIKPPLKVLVVSASPFGPPEIESESLKGQLEQAVPNQDKIDWRFLPHATLGTLSLGIQDQEIQGLHFMGHGEIDPFFRESRLLLEDNDGHRSTLGPTALANNLAFPRTRLVVLNACHGAASPPGAEDPFSGIATTLAQAGAPAVVAMGSTLTISAAERFQASFYRALADGEPLEVAMSRGRKAISPDCTQSLEWVVPRLYLRAKDGELFETLMNPPAIVGDKENARDGQVGGDNYATTIGTVNTTNFRIGRSSGG